MTMILRWRYVTPALGLRWRGQTDEMLEAIAANPAAPIAAIIGPRGAAGSGGGSINWVDGEAPAGVKNGTNRAYTLAHTPLFLTLVWNGMVQTEGVDFTIAGANITLLRDGPAADDVFSAFYTWE
jgi:hypothetical protein